MSDVAPYGFTDPWSGVAQGMKLGNALRSNNADLQAGTALQGGDYTGAANALYGSGDIDGGMAVTNAGQAQTARVKQNSDSQKQAVLAATGDIADHLAFVAQRSPKPEDVMATWDTLAPRLKALGESDDDIAQVRASLQSNPAMTIAALRTGVEKELGPQKPIELDPTKNAYLPNSGFEGPAAAPGAPGAPAAAPPPVAPPAPAVHPASSSVDPDAVWKSIKTQESGGQASPGTAVGPDTPYGNAYGSTQMLPATAEAMARKVGVAWNPALMRENSPQALAYQDRLGRAYFQEGLDRSGGDPAAAAAFYFGGPDPALHGPKTAAYVQQVMARAGAAPAASDAPLQGNDAGDAIAPPPVLPGYHLVQAAQPKDSVKWTSDGKGNLINANGDRKVDPTYDGAGAADPNIVKMVLDGRYPPPTGRAATDPKWQAVLEAASAQDPSFNAADYHTRYATRRDFTSGKSAQNITALNTALGHIGSLDGQIDDLGNTPLPAVNALKNYVEVQTGDPRLAAFNTDKKAVASELVRVFRQAGGSEADIQDFQKQLDAAGSPAQLHAATAEMTKLLGSRLDSLASQYKQGLGQDKDGLDFLTPKAQAIYSKLTGIPGSGAGATSQAAPQRLSPADAAKLPPGTHFVGLDGVQRVRH